MQLTDRSCNTFSPEKRNGQNKEKRCHRGICKNEYIAALCAFFARTYKIYSTRMATLPFPPMHLVSI